MAQEDAPCILTNPVGPELVGNCVRCPRSSCMVLANTTLHPPEILEQGMGGFNDCVEAQQIIADVAMGATVEWPE